ncbi:MAG TPA: biotin/lipoyl-containing protein [Pyrinomonadaceae bacterium]|jgi:biotin carboxyl carrier protein|nr:biotin/lipoyl-containing protein [Pyrinomonadaceae bacterium]
MKLRANISEFEFDVEIREQGSRVFAVVDGREYQLEQMKSSDTNFTLLGEGRVFDCRIEGQIASGSPLDIAVGPNHYAITLTDPKRLRSSLTGGAHSEGAVRIAAPMPGKIVRILVESGQAVEAGAGIVVVEAMKMQNEMKSPKAGTVVSIDVVAGATVNAGDVLAVIE